MSVVASLGRSRAVPFSRGAQARIEGLQAIASAHSARYRLRLSDAVIACLSVTGACERRSTRLAQTRHLGAKDRWTDGHRTRRTSNHDLIFWDHGCDGGGFCGCRGVTRVPGPMPSVSVSRSRTGRARHLPVLCSRGGRGRGRAAPGARTRSNFGATGACASPGVRQRLAILVHLCACSAVVECGGNVIGLCAAPT